MSLLIKALDKAQAEKAQAKADADKNLTDHSKKRVKSQGGQTPKTPVKKPDEDGLSLSPPEAALTTDAAVKNKTDETPMALKGSAADVLQKEAQQKAVENREATVINKPTPQLKLDEVKNPSSQAQAANMFTAKQVEPVNQTTKLALIVGFIALLIMAGLFYWYQKVFNVPDIVIPPRPAVVVSSQEMPAPLPEVTAELEDVAKPVEADISPEAEVVEEVSPEAKVAPKEQREKSNFAEANEMASSVEKTLAPNEAVVDSSVKITPSNVVPLNVGIASDSDSIKVMPAKTASDVNPILMRAYEAYNAGNDNQAQQDYKQVLQRYGLNVDAMLGLGAIATRQGRLADAGGWYRKVLEVEPRNEVANAGLLSIQQKNRPQSNESNIKSMLATAPDDANLHAALGDVYASRGQWSAAQQAYFDAYRLNPSGENAFNLGVSLDQLGKSKLALPYYQEALQKADQSSVIDAVALEARISSIQ